MDYKIVSPSEYFGTNGPMIGNNNVFISQNNIGNQMIPVILPQHQIHMGHSGNEGGLNVLASGAVAAAASAPPHGGYPYPANPTDNYGYIVNCYYCYYFYFIFIFIFLPTRDRIIEQLIIIQVKDILKLLLLWHQQQQIFLMPPPQLSHKNPQNPHSNSRQNHKIPVDTMEPVMLKGKVMKKEEILRI